MRVLLVRPDHLGDVLVTLPAVATLRRAAPGAVVTYALPPEVAEVCSRCPYVDVVVPVAFPPLDRPWWSADDPDVIAAAAGLGGPYDLAVLPRPDDPSAGALSVAAGVPVRAGFAMPRTAPFLTHLVPPPDVDRAVVAATHDLVAAGVIAVGRPPPPPLPPIGGAIVPTPTDHAEAAGLLGSGPHPVVMHPGSGWPVKNWPPHRWGQVARRLRARFGVRSVVAGTAAERSLVDRAVAAGGGAAHGVAGRLSVGGLAALQARARVVVGVDSGAIHLAAAVGTPTVALYGPGNPWQYAHAGEQHRVVRLGLPCSPCGSFERPPCGRPVDPACVTGVTVDAVTEAVSDLLSR
ncbi:MAG: glycosyltransferase family 9 protein [Actinoallomurus sp.]